MKKRILITGGCGFIGSYLCKDLLSQGHEIIVYDAFIQYISPFDSMYQKNLDIRFYGIRDKVQFVRGDTRDKGDTSRIINQYKPEIIIHLANLPIADLSYNHPEEAIGSILNGTINLLDAIRDQSYIQRFLYVSSSMVYGDFVEIPAREEIQKRPKDIYGGTKLAAETLLETYGRRYGIKYTIVRPSAVYGPGDVNRRVVQVFIENALSGKTIELHGGGSNMLDFTYVEDTARGIMLAALSDKAVNETFNITRGEGRSLVDLVEVMKKHIPDLKINYKEMPFYRPRRGALSIEKAKNLLSYQPRFSLEDGIEKYISSMRK